MWQKFLELEGYYGNEFSRWIIALVLALILWAAIYVLKEITARRLLVLAKRTKTDLDDLLAEMIQKINVLFLMLVSVYIGAKVLVLPEHVSSILFSAVLVGLFFQFALWGNRVITYWTLRTLRRRRETDPASATTLDAVTFFARVALWSAILLLGLNNFGVDITALLAGLGVGGIAVALAAQNILSDVFCSVAIILDKPFEVGDFIIVDSYLGVVERIGIKTTRVRSLSGEQIVFSNADLISSRVKNYKRMFERRVVFGFGVIYQTPAEKLEKIPAAVKEIIESIELTRFDRAHFFKYGDCSLDFEVVYYVLNRDYNIYMDIQQKINLALFRHFKDQGVDFAYPTRTLYLQKDEVS